MFRDIAIECNADEALVKALGYTRKMISHQFSKGEVINYLKRNEHAIGVVDDDPGSARPTYFSNFEVSVGEKFGIELLKIPHLETKLIVIKPRLEEWILRQANDLELDLKTYSIPNNGRELHKVINTRIPQFEAMLNDMIERKCKALIHLKYLIG